jgi:hypothetical protein
MIKFRCINDKDQGFNNMKVEAGQIYLGYEKNGRVYLKRKPGMMYFPWRFEIVKQSFFETEEEMLR